jgi:transcriptional regulator with XRE-family HTH domain
MSMSEVGFTRSGPEASLSDFISSRLRAARDLRGWSQKELARRAGIPTKTIEHYEIALSKPSLEMLRRLAGMLGVTTDYLLGVVDAPHAGAGDALFRAVDRLADEEREFARDFLQVLVERSRSKRDRQHNVVS